MARRPKRSFFEDGQSLITKWLLRAQSSASKKHKPSPKVIELGNEGVINSFYVASVKRSSISAASETPSTQSSESRRDMATPESDSPATNEPRIAPMREVLFPRSLISVLYERKQDDSSDLLDDSSCVSSLSRVSTLYTFTTNSPETNKLRIAPMRENLSPRNFLSVSAVTRRIHKSAYPDPGRCVQQPIPATTTVHCTRV
jgi:hypothetical protein